MKDYFSTQSKAYAAFRPTYPIELYAFIFQHLPQRNRAWDCATGNGQVAKYLSAYFQEVCATDISQKQLDHAVAGRNVQYSVGSAEKTNFPDNHFDLITVAQAIHWFDRDSFYNEVVRVGRRNSIVAVWGYGLLHIDPLIDQAILIEQAIMNFYNTTVGPYWDDARKLVEQHYKTIAFPFEEIQAPEFSIKVQWNIDQLSGYLSSWSATQNFIKEKGHDPVTPFIHDVQKVWVQQEVTVTFPIFTRIGKVDK